MQDRYAGDIGDFAKYALLRALSPEFKLGVAWYLHPDESGSTDGRHTTYLERPDEWRDLDGELYDGLRQLVQSGNRTVAAVESASLLPDAVYAGERLDTANVRLSCRSAYRCNWFRRVLKRLDGCDFVFADPDNGLLADSRFKPTWKKSAKSISESEARTLSKGRPMMIYHHNTRYKGGHRKEIAHWQGQLPGDVYAYYWRRWSNRTFFLVNGDSRILRALNCFAERWSPHGELIRP